MLAESFEVLCFDQRGLGQSDVPPGPYSMAEYGDDAAALLDTIGWDDCMVVGVSFGGMVAQELTLRHPAKVRRLVLACTSAGGVGGASFPLHDLLDLDPGQQATQRMPLLDTRWDAAWQAANPDMVRLITDGMGQRGWDDAESAPRAAPPAPGAKPPRHRLPSRRHRLPHPGLRWTHRWNRAAGQQRVPRLPHPGCPAGALRRRPPLLHAGRHGLPGHRRVPPSGGLSGLFTAGPLRTGGAVRAAAGGAADRATPSGGAASAAGVPRGAARKGSRASWRRSR